MFPPNFVCDQPQTQPCSALSQPQAGPQSHCGGRAITYATDVPVWQPHGQPAPEQLAQLQSAFIRWFMEISLLNNRLLRRTGLSDLRIVRVRRALDLNERADLRREGAIL
jgi:hypothetical protein